mmetsp:Transcript_55614/g.172339  ORF Transcript_55614/g.172339 Transcript_55614/m.172339 type:complete len:303 (+) Transcript_55614:14-922(+)
MTFTERGRSVASMFSAPATTSPSSIAQHARAIISLSSAAAKGAVGSGTAACGASPCPRAPRWRPHLLGAAAPRSLPLCVARPSRTRRPSPGGAAASSVASGRGARGRRWRSTAAVPPGARGGAAGAGRVARSRRRSGAWTCARCTSACWWGCSSACSRRPGPSSWTGARAAATSWAGPRSFTTWWAWAWTSSLRAWSGPSGTPSASSASSTGAMWSGFPTTSSTRFCRTRHSPTSTRTISAASSWIWRARSGWAAASGSVGTLPTSMVLTACTTGPSSCARSSGAAASPRRRRSTPDGLPAR